jgi:polyhydroxybutyrate depolymerase
VSESYTTHRTAALALTLGFLSACGGGRSSPADASVVEPSPDAAVTACDEKPGVLRGKSTQTVTVGRQTRSFIYYAPSGLDPHAPAPVVLVAHGFGMNAEQMYEITQYAALADREQFIVIFPNGQEANGPPWNVGDPDCSTTQGALPLASGDDESFVDAILAFTERDQCVDREHVFMTGFSMGAYFTNELGCTRSEFGAIAPHSGGSHDLTNCKGGRKAALILHFEGDSLVPYRCGTQARDRWLRRNECQASDPAVTAVEGGRCEYYKGCAEGGQVGMCSFTSPGGSRSELYSGHAWSGGSKEGSAGGGQYAISTTASATRLSWEFFEKYAW